MYARRQLQTLVRRPSLSSRTVFSAAVTDKTKDTQPPEMIAIAPRETARALPDIQARLQGADSARRDVAHHSERKPDGRAASLSPKQERHEQAFPLAGDVHPEKAVRYNARVADDEALLSSESHADARRVLGGYQGLG